ncbi:hypothetical protein WN55_02157 [Dufourea novaeangliae]|uniref:Gustatory receptor n=1 Tax=Dufourea novaeangliae TaxID=178035 RepID=A0A154NZ26_DUFNO|nr:hypothetical protein WN55_02157 [Dufourea novaeangliae]
MKRFIDVARHKTWKLFGVTNFVALNRPYTTFFAILGYFPYNISSSTYTFSKKWFAWSTMITILFTVVASYSMYIMNFVEKGLQEVSKNLHFNFYLILSLILVLRWYARFRSKLIVYQMICNVSREMPPECFTKIAKWIFSIDFLKFGIFFYILRNVISLKKMSVYSVVAWWSCLLVVTMNVLLRNNIYVLESCLRAINKSLEDLKTSLISDEPHLLRRVYHTQKNPVLLKELKVLRLRHLDILKTIDTVNEVFALENLVIVALLTVDVTFNLYTYLVNYTSDVEMFVGIDIVDQFCRTSNSIGIVETPYEFALTIAIGLGIKMYSIPLKENYVDLQIFPIIARNHTMSYSMPNKIFGVVLYASFAAELHDLGEGISDRRNTINKGRIRNFTDSKVNLEPFDPALHEQSSLDYCPLRGLGVKALNTVPNIFIEHPNVIHKFPSEIEIPLTRGKSITHSKDGMYYAFEP